MSDHPVKEFMKEMRETFGEFEFKAISPQGHIIQSKGWKEQTYRVEVIPQIQWKAENDRLANDSPQHPAKNASAKGKHKTRQAS